MLGSRNPPTTRSGRRNCFGWLRICMNRRYSRFKHLENVGALVEKMLYAKAFCRVSVWGGRVVGENDTNWTIAILFFGERAQDVKSIAPLQRYVDEDDIGT